MTLATALIKSINTVPVRLAKDHLAIPPIKAMAEAMGVESPLNVAQDHGARHVGHDGAWTRRPATTCSPMAALPARATPSPQLTTHSGDVFYDYEQGAPKPQRVLSEQAREVDELDPGAGARRCGTARRAALPGIRSAGKTGTTQSYRDAWYVGFTGNYTAAVWLGNDDFYADQAR